MMNFSIVGKNAIDEANAMTHSGVLHADEVFSSVILGKIMSEVRLARVSRVPENVSENVIVYDIGNGPFNHHQRGFNEARENGIKYSSFGLLWKQFGMELLSGEQNAELIFNMFDTTFVSGIDAVDNGQIEHSDILVPSVSSAISAFNPNWDEELNSDDCFIRAVKFAEIIFDNALNSVISKVKAKIEVEKSIENASNGIMVLETFMPWKEYLFKSDNPKANSILYVVYPSNREGYNINAVPESLGSFNQRKPLPDNWAGLQDNELSAESGVKTATFCHPGRFICGALTLPDALKMAQKAVENLKKD